MNLSKYIKFSAPTKAQAQRDAYLVVTAFIAAAVGSWQVQPDKFSKAAIVASGTAGIAAVLTIVKSICTTL